MRETHVQSLEKEMATHSSTRAWKIPWMEVPSRLQSMGSQRVGHDWATSLHFTSCNIALYSIRLYFHYQSQPPLDVVVALAPSLHSFWSYFSTDLQYILGTYWPGELLFQCPIFLPFRTVHEVFKARILKWFAIPFSSTPRFVRTLHHDLSVLGCPARHGP